MAPVSLIVVGAGQRGTGYARWARRHPERATVVAVAEPSPARRASLAAEHRITPQNAVTDWTELAGRGRLADAVLICTQDRMHAEPAEAFAALGYHILLEKPMAPDEAGFRRIVAAVEKAGVMLAVGHVMRYTPYTRAVKQIDAPMSCQGLGRHFGGLTLGFLRDGIPARGLGLRTRQGRAARWRVR